MELSRSERVRRALTYREVDRLPTQLNYTGSMGQAMARHFGVELTDLPERLDNHLVRLDLTYEPRLSDDGRARFDWWGAGHDTQEEGYFIRVNPLLDDRDLDKHEWPDPHDPHLLDDAAAVREKVGDRAFVVPNIGWALFERAWSLRGMENVLLEIALDPGYIGELLDRIVDIRLVVIERYLELGVDGGYFGDDYGAQVGTLFSPADWRTLIKPRLARLFAPFLERGLPVMMHSDGDIAPIVGDLVEIGLTALNPVQPEVVDHGWLQQAFGGRLAFYGGVSTQTVLPSGTPEEVKAAARKCVADLAPTGTGLMLAPSHRMMSDVSMANIEALMEVMGELG
ncbi:MAG: uroporphyrinogen decarboxylase family protein [Candidatus Limnocylindrales bacterium]